MKKVLFIVTSMVFLVACGGGSKEKEKSDTTQTKEKSEETTEDKSGGTEEKLCFAAEEQLTKAYANFIIKGKTVTGMMRYETPKAGMTLYEVGNVKGTKEGDKLTLTFTTVDTDTGQGLGESREEIWMLKGDELTQEEENVTGNLKKITCAENAEFQAEAPKAEDPQSYELDGVMNGKLKIKMFLTSKPDPEDKVTTIFEGYYYYLSQGKGKKIDLKGYSNARSVMAMELNEVVGEKTFGKFMIEGMPFGEEFTCTWVSADGKKEMKTVLKPAK